MASWTCHAKRNAAPQVAYLQTSLALAPSPCCSTHKHQGSQAANTMPATANDVVLANEACRVRLSLMDKSETRLIRYGYLLTASTWYIGGPPAEL